MLGKQYKEYTHSKKISLPDFQSVTSEYSHYETNFNQTNNSKLG
jgi:hypothetical protein